jgi:outer membrane receptor protein involved in Fe transport
MVTSVGLLCWWAAIAGAESPPEVVRPGTSETSDQQRGTTKVPEELEPAPAGERGVQSPDPASNTSAPDKKIAEAKPDAADSKQAVPPSELELFQLEDRFAALVVTTATRTANTADEAPAIVEVVSRQQIEEWGYQSIAEVLSKAVGFYVVDDHILPNVAVRGVSGGLLADSGVIKVLIDGRSVAFRTTAGNWLGPELIPLSAIERIEIVRGPASALYGADAFLGVVNIITRRGSALNGTQIGGGLSFQTLQPQAFGTNLDATVGLSRGRLEVLAALRLQSEDRSGLVLPASSPAPDIPSYNARNTVASGLDRYARVGLLRLTYNLSEQSSIYVTGYLSIDGRRW